MAKNKEKEISKGNHIAGVIFFVITAVMGVWCIDVSVSAIASGGYLTNGFFNTNAIQGYHIGLYWVLFSIVGMAFTYSHYIIMGYKCKK